MRSALSSRPGRPSSPARAGFARPSKIYLDRNSVVVLLALEFGHFVEIAVVERSQNRLERIMCAADIDHDSIVVEALGDKGSIHHECGAMHLLRGSKNRALERMGDHDVIANFDSEQGSSLRVDDGLAEYPAFGVENSRQSLRQIAERNGGRQQCIEPWIIEQRDCGGKSAAVRPARTMRWRDVSDLARYKPKPAAVERASKHRGHRRVTIPAHFQDRRFVSGQFECRPQSIGRAAGVNDEIAIGFCVSGLCETNPELAWLIPLGWS